MNSLQAGCQWFDLINIGHSFDFAFRWEIDFLQLAMHNRRVPEFYPGFVLVQELPANINHDSKWQVWPPLPPKPRRGRGRGRSRGRGSPAGVCGRGKGSSKGAPGFCGDFGRGRGRGGLIASSAVLDQIVCETDEEQCDAPDSDAASVTESESAKSDASKAASASSAKSSVGEPSSPSNKSVASFLDKCWSDDSSDHSEIEPVTETCDGPSTGGSDALPGSVDTVAPPPIPPPPYPAPASQSILQGGSAASSSQADVAMGETQNIGIERLPPVGTLFCGVFPSRVSAYRLGNFQATCKIPEHQPNCTNSKTSREPTGRRLVTHPGQGRPAVALVCWIEAGEGLTRDEHIAYQPPHVARRQRRAELKHDLNPGAALLLSFERHKFPHEVDSEPEIMDLNYR